MRDRNTHSVVVVERLKRRSDFRAAANGVRASGRSFALQARRRDDAGAVRCGFTVSKQVGDAVERNRVRRRLREAVEAVRVSAADGGQFRAGHDYVLIGRRTALVAPFGEMVRELHAALGRVYALEREGTGSARPGPLHEAGSPPCSSNPQQRRRQRDAPPASSPESSPALPARPPELPPQER